MYTESQIKELMETPIEKVLSLNGADTRHDRSWNYYSPFRKERTPSFHINIQKNLWYDFGMNEGGGVFKLVRMLLGLTEKETLDYLASISSIPFQAEEYAIKFRKPRENQITVRYCSEKFRNRALLDYSRSRGIPDDILERYCAEITYRISGMTGREFYAIGFPNDAGGWVLRSSSKKRCSSSAVTTMNPSKTGCAAPVSVKVAVFEGFFDFMSWIVYGGMSSSYDICVLNSVSNLDSAMPWIACHQRIDAFLDNDDAGRKALDVLKMYLDENTSNVYLSDRSVFYGGHKDLNEMLVDDIATGKPLILNKKHYGQHQ